MPSWLPRASSGLLVPWLVLLCAHWGAFAARPEDPSDLELLNLVATRYRANVESIRTWQGRARIQRLTHRAAPEPGRPKEQSLKALVTFVYHRVSGNLRSDYVLEENVNRFDDGTVCTYLLADEFTMVKDGKYYKFSRYPADRKGLASTPEGKLVESSGQKKRRAVEVYEAPPAQLERVPEHFNPVWRMTPAFPELMEKVFQGFYDRSKPGTAAAKAVEKALKRPDVQEALKKFEEARRAKGLTGPAETMKLARNGSIVTLRVGPSEATCNVNPIVA